MDFSLLSDFMDRLCAWRIPGNSVSVTLDGREVFSYQSGYADLENKKKMQGNELFNIYSCSKVATVVGALRLYERGYFLLDDPLYSFIPEYKGICYKDENGNVRECKTPITMRHLFTMTAGFTYNQSLPSYERARKETNGRMDTLAVIRSLAAEPLAFEPGSRFLYSVGHDVLAAVVEVISGMRFSEYMKKYIFDPLDMKETYYHADHLLDRMAQQYRYVNSSETNLVRLQSMGSGSADGHHENVGKACGSVLGVGYDSGGAGITTSVSDYSAFCAALACGGVSRTGERIISRASIDLLRENQLTTPALMQYFNWSQLRGYGYGLGVRTLIDKAKSGSTGNLGEFGWGGAAGATVLVDPSIRLSVFYTHHMLNPQEDYYQPRLRNVIYSCL